MNPIRPALALLLVAGTAAAQQPVPVDPARVDAIFAQFSGRGVPGCAVAVNRGGQPVLSRAYGMAELEHDVPITPETVFEAGSVSKQFTAAAVLLLAEEGKLSLDDDVRKHFPELPDYGETITVRHLLNHTSGLRDWGSVAGIEGWPRGLRAHDNGHALDIIARQRSLNYRPGEYYSYTNSGYNLQALLVERVSGMPFAEFTERRLFEPLGMGDTQWRDDFTEVVEGRAQAYRRGPGGDGFRLDMPFEYVHGNGGLLTTVADLLRWTEALEAGRGPLGAIREEMHRQAVLNGGRTIEYASGLFITDHLGVPEVSHGGATGGYRAYLARFPEQRVAVALLCNAAHANAGGLAHQVVRPFLGDAVRADAPVRGVTLPAAALAARAGTYRDTRTGQALFLGMEDGRLRIVDGPVLTPLSATRFHVDGEEIEFAGEGHVAVRRFAADGDTAHYEPLPAFRPTAADLGAYAGTYRSDEAEVALTVRLEGERLVVVDRYGEGRPLEPVYADAFGGPAGLYRFQRDGSGRVTGMSVGQSRVWDLRFRREP